MMGSPIELVRQGLYETITLTENSLERFILDRNDGVPLQEAIDGLQQLRGLLDVIELASPDAGSRNDATGDGDSGRSR